MTISSETNRDLTILEHLEQNPDATQASLASQLGVAVGTINWHLKRLIEKGYIKVRRAERRKLRYIITAEGMALRARLTIDYIQSSFHLYRLVRERALAALNLMIAAGHQRVRIGGDGDVAEVCRLTCLERGVEIADDASVPELKIRGLKIFALLDGNELKPSEIMRGAEREP
ncbi:MAG: winged helix-turn-helix transcriptional regulator [Anaerolineaceae bacterium]|nr:winged helix-turn-helix transcriptional regulator [Anaerolineaceae bacterium]